MRCVHSIAVLFLAYLLCLPLCVHAENRLLSTEGEEKPTSIQGTLLMLDGSTPHADVVVQVVSPVEDADQEPVLVANIISDERGHYQFTDLSPAPYFIRCHIPGAYVYHRTAAQPHGLRMASSPTEEQLASVLYMEPGQSLAYVDIYFAPFKKGRNTIVL